MNTYYFIMVALCLVFFFFGTAGIGRYFVSVLHWRKIINLTRSLYFLLFVCFFFSSFSLSCLLPLLINNTFNMVHIFLICALTASLYYSPVDADSSATSTFVRMPITRKPHSMDILDTARTRQKQRSHSSSLQKRESTFQASLYNDQGSQYLVSISVGTPPQHFSVTLDTGR